MASQISVQPLSRFKRSVYFLSLLLVFMIALPFLYLYATGYKFDGGTHIVPTGGLYVSADIRGAEIFINDELVRETGTFRRAFYLQDLEPGMYHVSVQKEDHQTWQKTLEVFPQIVTEAEAFTFPVAFEKEEILPFLIDVDTGSSTEEVNPFYETLTEVFSATTSIEENSVVREEDGVLQATVGTTTKESGGMILSEDHEGALVAEWTRTLDTIPYYFCDTQKECDTRIVIDVDEIPEYFDFVPGNNNLVLLVLESGVYVSEIDPRDTQNRQRLYEGSALDARVYEGGVFIKEENIFFEIEL